MIDPILSIRRDPSLIQVLSLYLLLLAFFVLLYNHSRVEDAKARRVAGSLQATFAQPREKRDEPTPSTSPLADNLAAAQFLESIRQTVKRQIPLAELDIVKRGRLLRARLAENDLFREGSSEIWEGRRDMIGRIAEAMAAHPAGLRYDLEVLFASPWITPRQLGNSPPLVIRRATAMAQALERQGAPSGSVSVGVRQGETGWIDLKFHVRSEEESRQALPVDGADGAAP